MIKNHRVHQFRCAEVILTGETVAPCQKNSHVLIGLNIQNKSVTPHAPHVGVLNGVYRYIQIMVYYCGKKSSFVRRSNGVNHCWLVMTQTIAK